MSQSQMEDKQMGDQLVAHFYIRPIFPVRRRHIVPRVHTATISITAMIKRCTGVIPSILPLVLRLGAATFTTSSGTIVSSSYKDDSASSRRLSNMAKVYHGTGRRCTSPNCTIMNLLCSSRRLKLPSDSRPSNSPMIGFSPLPWT